LKHHSTDSNGMIIIVISSINSFLIRHRLTASIIKEFDTI